VRTGRNCSSLAVSLPQVPADIDQVRAVITLDDATSSADRSAGVVSSSETTTSETVSGPF